MFNLPLIRRYNIVGIGIMGILYHHAVYRDIVVVFSVTVYCKVISNIINTRNSKNKI